MISFKRAGGWCAAVLFLFPASAPAQAAKPGAAAAAPAPVAAINPADTAQVADYVARHFGPSFKVTPMRPRGTGGRILSATPLVFLAADLDGDGAEDAIIVTQSKNPLPDQQSFAYKVIDPYDAYFGYADPKITHQFATQDPDNEHALLIVHDWRSAQPKRKFCIINLPFDNLEIRMVQAKKKQRATIVASESGILESVVFWDGKRYRYEPSMGGE